eukprot:Rhum_TRINITY_DN13502_c0_g2::Rhum_TRINITY_DN13502_c0_g2_i1::g.60758::m.60758
MHRHLTLVPRVVPRQPRLRRVASQREQQPVAAPHQPPPPLRHVRVEPPVAVRRRRRQPHGHLVGPLRDAPRHRAQSVLLCHRRSPGDCPLQGTRDPQPARGFPAVLQPQPATVGRCPHRRRRRRRRRLVQALRRAPRVEACQKVVGQRERRTQRDGCGAQLREEVRVGRQRGGRHAQRRVRQALQAEGAADGGRRRQDARVRQVVGDAAVQRVHLLLHRVDHIHAASARGHGTCEVLVQETCARPPPRVHLDLDVLPLRDQVAEHHLVPLHLAALHAPPVELLEREGEVDGCDRLVRPLPRHLSLLLCVQLRLLLQRLRLRVHERRVRLVNLLEAPLRHRLVVRVLVGMPPDGLAFVRLRHLCGAAAEGDAQRIGVADKAFEHLGGDVENIAFLFVAHCVCVWRVGEGGGGRRRVALPLAPSVRTACKRPNEVQIL